MDFSVEPTPLSNFIVLNENEKTISWTDAVFEDKGTYVINLGATVTQDDSTTCVANTSFTLSVGAPCQMTEDTDFSVISSQIPDQTFYLVDQLG